VLILTILQTVTANEWLALIFPWRVSVILVPIGTTILIAWAVTKFMDWIKDSHKAEQWLGLISLLAMIVLMIIGALRFQIESARQLADPALPMMDFVAAHKSPGDIYMVPSKLEQFRLVTGAPVLVDFKSTPDRDADVMEWYQRLQWISWFYESSKASNPCQNLKNIAAKYGVTHVVVDPNNRFTVCKSLPVIYEDASYRVYALSFPK
jgi:hypothetical protein